MHWAMSKTLKERLLSLYMTPENRLRMQHQLLRKLSLEIQCMAMIIGLSVQGRPQIDKLWADKHLPALPSVEDEIEIAFHLACFIFSASGGKWKRGRCSLKIISQPIFTISWRSSLKLIYISQNKSPPRDSIAGLTTLSWRHYDGNTIVESKLPVGWRRRYSRP